MGQGELRVLLLCHLPQKLPISDFIFTRTSFYLILLQRIFSALTREFLVPPPLTISGVPQPHLLLLELYNCPCLHSLTCNLDSTPIIMITSQQLPLNTIPLLPLLNSPSSGKNTTLCLLCIIPKRLNVVEKNTAMLSELS